TSIYGSRHRKDDICFRGRMKEDCHVKCLPADALIDTPEGPVSVETLRVGDPVWSVDTLGNRVQTSVEAAGATPVRGHRIVHLGLDDGRVVRASGPHPLADGRLVGDVVVGDVVDGARVVSIERVAYTDHATFDIRPASTTGLYFADGVLMGTTLA